MSAPSDRDLIQRTRRGEAEAFGELVLHERADVEGLTQETFSRVRDRLNNRTSEEIFPEYKPRSPNVIL
jgi:hypothetical protein